MMGTVARAAADSGGSVLGIIPVAMAENGEGDKSIPSDAKKLVKVEMDCATHQTIIVNSMHERKVEMAKRACGFLGLPGGFGTFEEVFEVTTWTQIGIHDKPVVLLNVLNYYEPVRTMIEASIDAGFVQPFNDRLINIVDGPENLDDHESFDWGAAALQALAGWKKGETRSVYDWGKRLDGLQSSDALHAS